MQQKAVHDVEFYSAAGVLVGPQQSLASGTTYYAELGGPDNPWSSIQWKWDAAVIVTAITVESSNLPTSQGGLGSEFWAGVSPFAAAADGWHPETAVASIAIAGGTAGNQLVHIGGGGQMRLRAKIVVGATGGKLRGRPHHKS